MKQTLLSIIAVGLLLTAGCGPEFATGAAAGGAAVGSLTAAKEYYTQQLADAQTEEELQLARTMLDTIAIVEAAGKTVTTTDWKTPTETAAGAALITNLLTQLWLKRKKKV